MIANGKICMQVVYTVTGPTSDIADQTKLDCCREYYSVMDQ